LIAMFYPAPRVDRWDAMIAAVVLAVLLACAAVLRLA